MSFSERSNDAILRWSVLRPGDRAAAWPHHVLTKHQMFYLVTDPLKQHWYKSNSGRTLLSSPDELQAKQLLKRDTTLSSTSATTDPVYLQSVIKATTGGRPIEDIETATAATMSRAVIFFSTVITAVWLETEVSPMWTTTLERQRRKIALQYTVNEGTGCFRRTRHSWSCIWCEPSGQVRQNWSTLPIRYETTGPFIESLHQ